MAAFLCLLGLFAVALATLGGGSLHVLDSEVLARLSRHDRDIAHSSAEVLRLLGELGPQIFLLAGVATIGWCRGLPQRAVAGVVLVAGADLSCQILKHLIADDRYGPLAHRFPVNEHTFPSGHATTMTALTFAFLLVIPPRWRVPTAMIGSLLTVLVGGAMVMLHRHWPSDVLGGILLGCAWGFGATAMLAGRR